MRQVKEYVDGAGSGEDGKRQDQAVSQGRGKAEAAGRSGGCRQF